MDGSRYHSAFKAVNGARCTWRQSNGEIAADHLLVDCDGLRPLAYSSMPASQTPWRLLIHEPLPPPIALAIDEAIALACAGRGGTPTLRFYQWNRPAVSIGRFQMVDQAVRADPCRSAGVPVLRRITGGRAVWHRDELTYSLVCPLPSSLFPSALSGTVAVIGRALAASLQQLGLPVDGPAISDRPVDRVERAQWDRARTSSYCFDGPSWYEVTLKGKKVIGSAQRRWRDRFLQQGSILLRHDAEEVARWLPVGDADLQAAAGLEDFLPAPVTAHRLAHHLARSLASIWNITLIPGTLTAEESRLANALSQDKYADEEWTIQGAAPNRARS
jgi:lipoate-protein ligase A